MKIGLVRRGYSASGGAERYLLRFAAGLTEAGHQWRLFSDAEWPADLIADYGGEQQRIRRADSPRAFANSLRKARPRDHCDCLFSLERVWECDAYRAGDGVHAAWLDRRAASERGRGFSGLANWWRRRRAKHREILQLEQALYDPASGPTVITNSQFVKREIVDYYATPESRLHCVTNGYDAPPLSDAERKALRQSKRAKLGLEDGEAGVLFTGSGWERKGLASAIQAVDTLGGSQPKITLLVAGSGKTQRQTCPTDAVRFLGSVPASEMSALYEAADLFVLPTLYDPFSNASLEAAAHGLPVITTPANGFSELIPDDHTVGSVVPVDDTNALAAAIATWATGNDYDRGAIRQWAAQWSVDRNVTETLKVLEALQG
jgi:UDP-glucose:(heptosyl)LPS alpha-1,3-glucosyltransferase